MPLAVPAHGLCRGCLRALSEAGAHLNGFCDGCDLLVHRYPGVDLTTLRNGRTEVVPQERPVRHWRWRDDAACRGADVELFCQSAKKGSPRVPVEVVQAARVFCRGCPVLQECRAEADAHLYVGLWGGAFRRLIGGTSARKYQVRDLLGGMQVPRGSAAGRSPRAPRRVAAG